MIRVVVAALAFIVLSLLLLGALALIGLLAVSMIRGSWRGAASMAYSRTLCKLLGIRIQTIGAPVHGRPVLVVANHCSWVDILVITATAPTIFVAKSEVARWPLVGWIAKVRGTVFVDRSRRHQTGDVNAEIAARLAEGAAIVLFGEGTSSDGNRVLPFRTALLGAVNDALARLDLGEILVQPLSIAYTRVHGLPMGRQHRAIAAWYGDLSMVPHLTTFITRGPVDVVMTWGAPMVLGGAADRKAVAKALESAVRQMTNAATRGRPFPAESRPLSPDAIDSSGKITSAEPATRAGAAG